MTLGDTLTAARARQLLRLRRRLLASPLLHKADAAELWPLAVRHRHELARWFIVNLGWRLVVDPAGEFARLHKVAAAPDPTRPPTVNDTPLTTRKYTLLYLACAALDEQPQLTTISVLAANVTELSAAEETIQTFDPSNLHADRLAFAGAMRWLAAAHVITVRDGSLDAYVADPTADALLDVNDRLLAQLLACPISPALVDDPADVLDEVYPSGASGRSVRAGHRVLRRLADDPLVYYDDLTDEERDWIGPRWQVINRVAADLGLVVERRAEGLAAIDPAGGEAASDEPISDLRFPAAGSTVAHCALLLAEFLVGRHQAERGEAGHRAPETTAAAATPAPIPRSALVAHVRVLIDDYADRCGWARWVHGDDGPGSLLDQALDHLACFRLVHRLEHAVIPTPALARFGVATPSARSSR
jgi:uncharacterized protein (TIGR02678 family)